MFSRSQARAVGLSDRQVELRVESGLWTPVLPKIYRFSGTPPSDDLTRRAALMWAGHRALLSHRSAALVWGLDGVESEPRPEITVVGARHPKSDRVTVHRTLALPPRDKRLSNGRAITSPARTVIDLASVLDAESLECAFESARRMRLTTAPELMRRLEIVGGRGRRGAGQLNGILEAVAGQKPVESTLEVRVARLLRTADVPPPVRQYWIRVFGVRYRVDFAWPDIKIALECDSKRWHEFQRDRTRWRRLCASGWRILPITQRDATRDWESVLLEIQAALGTIGHSATLTVAE